MNPSLQPQLMINCIEDLIKKQCSVYDIKLHQMIKLLVWDVWNNLSLPLLPGSLRSVVIVSNKVLSEGEISLTSYQVSI